MSDVTTNGTEWICYPCSEVVPGREGRLKVYGEHDPDRLTVWCPWCGDKMDWLQGTDIEHGEEESLRGSSHE